MFKKLPQVGEQQLEFVLSIKGKVEVKKDENAISDEFSTFNG